MPCYEIRKSTVEFLPASTDPELLAAALRALGYRTALGEMVLTFDGGRERGSYDRETGKLTIVGNLQIDAVKRSYSKQVVESQAKKFGWKLLWQTTPEGLEEATVARRV